VEVGNYLQVYDVDIEDKIAAFYQKQLESADRKQGPAFRGVWGTFNPE